MVNIPSQSFDKKHFHSKSQRTWHFPTFPLNKIQRAFASSALPGYRNRFRRREFQKRFSVSPTALNCTIESQIELEANYLQSLEKLKARITTAVFTAAARGHGVRLTFKFPSRCTKLRRAGNTVRGFSNVNTPEDRRRVNDIRHG